MSIAIVFWPFTGKSIWWKKCNELQLLLYLVIDWNLASIYTKWFWQQFYFCCCFLWSRNDRIIILIENRIFSFVGTRRVEKRSFENFFDITSFVWSWESERLKLVALFKLRAVGEIWIDKVVSVANFCYFKNKKKCS